MIHVDKNRKKLLISSIFLILILLSAVFVNAQFFGDSYVVRTIHVFPSQIKAEGWNNVETITFQNLKEYALIQDFNGINSATIDPSRVNQLDGSRKSASQNETSSATTPDPVSSEEVENVSVDNEDAEPESISPTSSEVDFSVSLPDTPLEDFETLDSTQTTTTEITEPEVQSPVVDEDVEEEAATTTVMRRVESLFALAVSAVTSVFDSASSTEEVESVDNTTTPEPFPEETEYAESENQASTTSAISEDTPAVEVEPVANVPEATTTEEVAEDEIVSVDIEVTASTTGEEAEPVQIPEIESSGDEEAISPTPCLDNCQPYSILLSDFGYPMEEGVEVSGAQLRMSFAAARKMTREHIPVFSVNYSIDGGVSWLAAGSIMIDDEVSNSINGGYYLFALPELTEQSTLNSLQVELLYEDDPEVIKDLFVESVWLELFTLEAPEEEPADGFMSMLAEDGYKDEVMSGDVLELPDGRELNFEFTDDNKNETLIIKTDRENYEGLSEAVTYFSVTNTANSSDEFSIKTYFPNGVGEVTSLDIFNQNKGIDVTVPEYRPYVYHCEAGWEYAGDYDPSSLEELSKQFSEEANNESENDVVDTNVEAEQPLVEQAEASTTTEVEFVAPEVIEPEDIETEQFDIPTNTTTTVFRTLPSVTQLLQFSTTTSLTDAEVENVELDSGDETVDSPAEEQIPAYLCRNTNVVRECDEIDGANTACRINQVKVQDHKLTRYTSGWEDTEVVEGDLPKASLFKRAAAFIGFGPNKKTVPDRFEVRAHSDEKYLIEPGETKYFKMEISFPPFSNGEYWIEAVGDSEYGLLDPFWSSQWQYRMPILIDNTEGTSALTEQQVFLELDSALTDFWSNVNSDGSDIRFVQETSVGNLFPELTPEFDNALGTAWSGRIALTIPASSVTSGVNEFPVFVDLATLGDYFWSGVASDGRDIRVTKSDGSTELPFDLVEIDTVAKTGELHFLADSLNGIADNIFHIYFDNPSASAYSPSSQYGSEAVWVNYEAVYHFSDDPTSVSNTISDETGNGQDLVVTGAALATTTGAMGTALDMTLTTTGYLQDNGYDWAWTSGDDHVSSGLYYQTSASAEAIWQWGTTNNPNWLSYIPWYSNAVATGRGYLYFGLNQNGTWAHNDTSWNHFTTIAPATLGHLHGIYENGVLELSNTQNTADPSNAGGLQVGRYTTAGSYDGYIDELRFASDDTVYSSGWITTENLNQLNPTTFYSTSTSVLAGGDSVSGWYSTSWNGRQKITLPSSDNITDFPVYVDLSTLGDDFFAEVASDGRDIRVTKADNKTELPFELVNINTGAKTGELYFKTNLTSNGDSDYYIYFGNSDAAAYAPSATYGAQNVWTNNYRAVYHLQESAAGTGNANIYKDSTANQYHGDDQNASNDKTGRFGAGQEFGDDQNDHLSLPNEVLDGVSDLTTSWWHLSTTTGTAQTIVSAAKDNTGAGANEYYVWFSSDTNFQIAIQNGAESFGLSDTITTHTDGNWNYFVSTMEDSIDEVNFYVNGVGDSENPDPQPVATLSVANGGLIVGQEQDALGGGFQDTQNFEGLLDELRFASVVRDATWVEAEYNNQNSPATFYSTSSVETLTTAEFVELDFWIQHFDDSGDEADIWVQVESVPAGEQALIYMYYGNSGASSASDEMATFSYSTSTDLFYVVDDSGGSQISVQSLIDDNEVSIDGGAPVSLDQGELTTFTTFSGSSVISVLGPISGTITGSGNDGSDMLAPISFATTTHVSPTDRSTNRWYIVAPFASTTARTYIGNSGTADQTFNIGTSSVVTATADPADPGNNNDGSGVVFEASSPVLVSHRHTVPGDGMVLYPPTTRDLFGIDSQYILLSAVADDPNPTITCSNGSSAGLTGTTRGEKDDITQCTTGSQGTGHAVRFSGAASPITAIQLADGDGNESTVYWPQHEFGTRYALTNVGAYIAVACSPRFGTVNIEVQDSTGSLIESGTCTPTASAPGKAYFTNGTGNGNSVNFAVGTQVVSTNDVPFYVIYEDVTSDQDEKNIGGAVQARKFGSDSFKYTFGTQELAINADFEQLSYAWYQNGNVQTPTTTWALSPTEFLSEGENITGAGALADGEVARLRMNLLASNATGSADYNAFKLQYTQAAAGQCSLSTGWFDLGEIGSTTAVFSGYDNTSVSDGSTLSTSLLASSSKKATYEERNLSNFLPSDILVGQVAEWDWVIQATNIAVNTNYCFRMVRSGGAELETYTSYPELVTVGPPSTPTLFLDFDNEKTAVLSPVLEFVASDLANDDIHYEVQIDDDVNFGSIAVNRNSQSHSANFENLIVPSDKSPFNSGQRVRFTSPTALSASTTYWWRVRASDPTGSGTSSEWSAPFSFTTDGSVTISEWHQTTGDQFATNALTSLTTSAGAVSVSGSSGQMVSTPIDFDDASVGNAWGSISWNDTETSGTIKYQVEYLNGSTWSLVPNSMIPSNNVGIGASPINILELDTDTYNEIRLVANFTGTTLSIQDWTVSWGLRVETPVLGDPFDNQKTVDTLPLFDFVSSDPQGDDLEYEISWSTDYTFAGASTTHNSSVDPGFSNIVSGGDTDPFNSGDSIRYTTQVGEPFTNGQTYWWRARAKDPAGGDAWSPWSDPDSFTVDTGLTISTWFQTTQEQFAQGILDGVVASTSDSVVMAEDIGEYGTVSLTNNNWTTVATQNDYNNMVVVGSPEYAATTVNGRSVRVRNKTSNSFEIKVDDDLETLTGSTDVDYLVMEAGTWNVANGSGGTKVVAGTESLVSRELIQPYATGYIAGPQIDFSPAFSSAPAAAATISSDNDTSWVMTHVDGCTDSQTEVSTTRMCVTMAASTIDIADHEPEDIDYIAFGTVNGTNNGVSFKVFNSSDTVTHSATSVSFPTAFTSTPAVTIVFNNAEDGGDGAMGVKTTSGTNNASTISLQAVELGPQEGNHTDEIMSVMAFENSSGIIKRDNSSGTLVGTYYGEDIIFTDGTGPKFESFTATDSEPGSSSIVYKIQYKVSEGVYALIPNGIIPGNSAGTSTTPIDLTGVDIDTYPVIRAVATLTCVSGVCPSLDEWKVEWSEGVDMSGTLKEYDRLTSVATGTIRAAVNGSIVGGSGTVAGGVWTLPNVTAFAGDIVTVWVDGATESEEAVTAFVYDGLGDISGVELFEQHLTISADEEGSVTNTLLAQYDNSVSADEDIFFDVDAFGNLTVCSVGACSEANIYVGPGNTYVPAGAGGVSVSTHDFINNGIIELDSNTFNVSGSWNNNATSSTDTSTINMTAATGTESVVSIETPLNFHHLSFGAGAGNATFTIPAALDLSGNLTVASGTLDRTDLAINVAGNVTTGAAGTWYGYATTTFDGSGTSYWSDAHSTSTTQNIGSVYVDGASKQVIASTNVRAYDITIGVNDILAGSSGNTFYVAGDFINEGVFNAQSGTVEIINDDRTYPPIVPGSQDWYADSAFDSRIMVDIDPLEVAGDLTNFPVYVNLANLGNDFWSDVTSNGRDIRVTNGDGQTELPHDLVSINTTSKTGELHFLADSVDSSTTTTFFIYFNNPAASAYNPSATYGREAVWAEYEAVYHFKDDPTSVSNSIEDASTNERDLLVEGAGLATSTGRLGLGLSFYSSSGLLRNAGFIWEPGDPLTTSGWYKMTAASNEALWQWGTGASPHNIEFRPWYSGNNGLHYFGVTSGATYAITPRDTTNWLHFTTIGATSTSEDNLVYQNTIEVERITQTVADPNNNGATGLQLGRNGTGGTIGAEIDEFRVTTAYRNTDWIEAEYTNQSNPTTFYSTSSVQSYVPDLVIDEATHNIKANGSSFFNFIVNDATTSIAFTGPSVVVGGTFTIATGTVALPTGKLTVGKSFINNGYFMHNNAEVEFISSTNATITLNGTEFLNVFYNLTFSGAGTWNFTDTNATSSNDVVINNGTVNFPSGVFSIGGLLDVNGGGFDANGGTVLFTSEDNELITTLGSSFNDVVFGQNDSSSGWYNIDWNERMSITVASTSVIGTVNNFPVYVDLASFGSEFWNAVTGSGRDIRVTTGNGKTQVPIDLVEISVGDNTGELHFLAPSLSPTVDTTFYIYFDNDDAVAPTVDSTYGRNAVWKDYEAVYHFNEDPTGTITDMTGNGKDLTALVGVPSTTVGILGTALDLTSASVMVGDADWTWTSGEDLVSSGVYYQSAVDTGALWEFGSACGGNDGTCLAFMPWYTGTTGYHRFGVTSGDTYSFTRNGSIWHHFTTNGRATAGQSNHIYEDGVLRGSVLQTAPAQNPTNTGLQIGRYTGGTYMDIQVDELRFATTTRSEQWITTEYNNLTDTDTFYSTSSQSYLDVVASFTLNEINSDADGDVTIYYADLVAPTNNFTIGGSAYNYGGSYNPNNATTTFNSNDTGEVLQFGKGSFYNLSFNGAGGGWTISTTTVINNASLVTGAAFTLATNTKMTVSGMFSNTFNSAATTWSGSTLALDGGDYTVTGKSGSGDSYATLVVSNDSNIVIWNSSISTSSIKDTSSLYMPDYAGADGALRIYGTYEKLSGSEYWNYARDFDGTDLTGAGERPVDVKIGRGSSLYFGTSTTLEAKGISTATTSISAITGIYTLNVNAGTADIEYASFQNVGPKGLYLTNGTVVNDLLNSEFAVAGGRSGITADAATINAQPSSEFTNIIFGTSTANSIYDSAWSDQVIVTVQASAINEKLTNFPVYVDLSTLGSGFWSGVTTDGRDIRVTTGNGTELPIDLVEIDTVAETGELHFLAPTLTVTDNSVFYVHFDNPSATAYVDSDEFGANAVWADYEAVYHFNEDPTISITDKTGNDRDLVPTVGSMATTTGLLGTALDTTGNNMLQNLGWTWTGGDDLVSTGLYFMTTNDTGALWQFGNGSGGNTKTYLTLLPWYNTATRGYNRFGVTTGSEFDFARNNTIWHHFATLGRAASGEEVEYYEDNVLRDSVTQLVSSENPTNTGLKIGRYQTGNYLDALIDELRFSTTIPSINRIDAEYKNLTAPTTFYATSSEQTFSYNVTAVGVPTTFWLFSGGSGNIYGEAFDNDDGDPGSIQWDDSNFAVTISGVVYSDDGVTPASAPLCNASTEVVTVVLDGVTSFTAPCDPIDGSFSVTGITYTGEPQITTYINSEATETQTNVAIYDEITGVGTVASNLMTVSRPNVIDGSVLVLIAGKDDDINFGTPAGWTSIDILGNTTGDQIATGIWYRVVADAGTEASTYDFPITDNGEEFNYWMGSLLNVDNVTPVDVASTWTKVQNSSSPDAPQVTTVTNGALVLSAWYAYIDNEVVLPVYNWDERASNIIGVNNNLSVASRLMTTSGATGSSTLDGVIATRETHAGQFAFRPASAPTATGTIVAAAVTKTPIGNSAPYETVTLRDKRSGFGTVAAAANVTINRPSVENNDVLVMVIGKEDDYSFSGPAGWSVGADRLEATGNDMYSAIWYKVVTNAGAEPATYDFVNNDTSIEEYSYWIGSFSGVDTTNVFDVTPSWDNLQNDSSPAAPSLTTVRAGAYVLAAWYVIDDGAMDMPSSPWTTLAQDLVQANRLLAVSGRSMSTVGSTGNAVLTGGSTDDVNVGQFALRPAPISVASSIDDMHLYQNRVSVRHSNIDPLTIADMAVFDNDDDTDLPFTATVGAPDNLTVFAGNGLVVWNNRTFDAGGEIDLEGVGSTAVDGSLLVKTGGTLLANSTDPITIGGSLHMETGATFNSASSLVTFAANNPGHSITSAASSTLTLYDTAFTGVGGGWAVQTPLVSLTNMSVATGTVSGVANITIENGSLSGNGTVNLTGGTTLIKKANTLGGTRPWTFNNLTLGNGTTGITTPAGTATTSVRGVLTIAAAHFLDANNSVWDLQGNGNALVESGTFIEDTSTVRFSGTTQNIKQTPYYNLVVDTDRGGSVTATAPTTGLQVLNNLTIGALGTSTLNANTNDPVFSVSKNVYIGTLGTLLASDSKTLTVNGSWNNDGVFTANGGTTTFSGVSGSYTIAAGNSPFAKLSVLGSANYTFTENATTTGNMTLTTGTFVLNPGLTLAVGGKFTNTMLDVLTTWTGTTLSLYSGTAFTINAKTTGDNYNSIVIAANTHPRLWNSTTSVITTAPGGSLYSMDHQRVDGSLYIFGDFKNTSYNDYWSYANDFDGAALATKRKANVRIENGGSVLYTGGSLNVVGTTTASTTIDVQSAGTYQMTLGGSTALNLGYYSLRNTTIDGLIFTGSPSVTDISRGDFEVSIAGGSGMTVGATAINANPARNFTNNRFATTTAINAFNVTATGSAVSSWRFVNVDGNLGGEAKDVDPGGDPGYIVWQDSAAIINISGNVYSDEGSSASLVCNGITNNVVLSIQGLTFASTSCAAVTGAYSFTGIGYGPSDTLTVYIDGEAVQAATVTKDPISSISNMDLYEDRVIVRHESASPQTIAAMSVWDSSDDADIPFTAVDAGTDTLTLPADKKLIVWTGKTFAPAGNVTVSGGGAGDAVDGTVELYDNAKFTAANGQSHTIGGSLLMGTNSVFTPAQSAVTFTSAAAGRTIDTNESGFFDLTFNGAGAWTMSDTALLVGDDFIITNGGVTLPAATTTVSGSFNNTGGTFNANNGLLVLNSTATGKTVRFNGSSAHNVRFNGTGGGWTFADTSATTTDSFRVQAGAVTLPSGTMAVTGDFIVNSTITHNNGLVKLLDTAGGNLITLSGNDLANLTIEAGAGDYTLTNASAALLGDLLLTSGDLTVGTGTVSIGGSFNATGGVFNNGLGTLLFNSTDTGELIEPGSNDLYNVVLAGTGGGWTIPSGATTTNNFTLSVGSSFTLSTTTTLYVGGVFTNTLAGAATTWTGSTLVLDSGTEYETNLKTTPTELYSTVVIGANTDVSMWNSSALAVSVPATASLYSQDHASVDGSLYVFGDYHISTTTENWSRAKDFDGAVLGSPRPASVYIASSSIVSLDGGALSMIGISGASTTVTNQGSGAYTFIVSSGDFDASYYSFRNLDSAGLQLTGNADVNSLSYGDFEQAANSTTLITLASTTLNANASLSIVDTRFADGGFTAGNNVSLDATTTNSWIFTGAIGDLWGEAFDIDGTDDCSSIRWDDSSCLLTEQTTYRWRNDDGGEGAAPGTWYSGSWAARKRIRIVNADTTAYTDVAVKTTVAYDSDMQTDFDDLRFTNSTGTTTLSYWVEKYTAGVSADVWVKLPSLGSKAVAEVYMYYGNVSATSTGDPSDVFDVYDDFEDNDIAEYSGDTSLFNTAGTFAYGGGFGLDTAGNESAKATDGIGRTDVSVSQGHLIRYMQYVDTGAGSGDEVCTMFGVQSPVTANNNYAVCLEQFGTDRISLMKNVQNTDSTGTMLGSSTATFSTGWYEVEIDWQANNDIDVSLYTAAGALVATTSANDSTYTSGGIGFTFWFQNGGWDSYVASPRMNTKPSVYFGAEQVNGGASWAAAQNTPVGGFAFGETARLRIGIENSGLPITNQKFRLEFAPKLTAPNCEAVSAGNYVSVPVLASCGSSAVCMANSASTTNGNPTTDHLVTKAGTFVAGKIVEETSNQTTNLNIDQNRYTELEYSVQLTVNAVNDAYCFRVTDAGSALDSYGSIPELTLAFDPVLDPISLNGGLDITLSPGATTTIVASTTASDFNGFGDLTYATTTFYKTSAGGSCTPDNNDCYIATSTACSFTACAGNSCTLTCSADFQFHADPTDQDGGEEWFAFMEVSDASGAVDFGTSIGVELMTLRALDVQNSIGYGTVDVNQNTGTYNPSTSLLNIGNEAIDVQISGTDMTDGVASVIPSTQQRFATTTFDYAACGSCNALTITGTNLEVDLSKPVVDSPPVTDSVYWGIEVPFGTASAPHTGINYFTAISD